MITHHASLGASDLNTNLLKPLYKFLSQLVNSRELREVMCESICSGSREKADLTHPPTEEFSEPFCTGDEIFGAD